MSASASPHPGTLANLEVREGFNNITFRGTRRTEDFYFDVNAPPIRSEFCAVSRTIPRLYYEATRWTGIVGLSLSPNPSPYFALPIWITMMNQDMLNHNVFSVWMRDFYREIDEDEEDDEDDVGGAIVFGGADRDHYVGVHEFYNLIEGCHEWKLQMNFIVVQGNREILTGKALIHTGSPYIYGPRRIIRAINLQILGGHREGPVFGDDEMANNDEVERTIFTVGEMENAPYMPHVSFSFFGGERTYTLTSQQYILPDERVQSRYTSIFRPRDFQPNEHEYIILGMPFLRKYHSIFDFQQRRIGFAESAR